MISEDFSACLSDGGLGPRIHHGRMLPTRAADAARGEREKSTANSGVKPFSTSTVFRGKTKITDHGKRKKNCSRLERKNERWNSGLAIKTFSSPEK